jgi:hypothetical protein
MSDTQSLPSTYDLGQQAIFTQAQALADLRQNGGLDGYGPPDENGKRRPMQSPEEVNTGLSPSINDDDGDKPQTGSRASKACGECRKASEWTSCEHLACA